MKIILRSIPGTGIFMGLHLYQRCLESDDEDNFKDMICYLIQYSSNETVKLFCDSLLNTQTQIVK